MCIYIEHLKNSPDLYGEVGKVRLGNRYGTSEYAEMCLHNTYISILTYRNIIPDAMRSKQVYISIHDVDTCTLIDGG